MFCFRCQLGNLRTLTPWARTYDDVLRIDAEGREPLHRVEKGRGSLNDVSVVRRDPFVDVQGLAKRVYAYVAYRIGEGQDAEDVTSETFVQALRYRESYDPSRGEPVAWLVGIARREIAQHFAARREIPVEAPGAEDPGGLDEGAATDLRLDVMEALDTLGARERELVALRYGADLTARQIAELLELRPNTVEVALHRALARLRGLLLEDAPETATAAEPAAPPQSSAA
jgi:RNA polymerase sigma-70 factor (ECF subfamily)